MCSWAIKLQIASLRVSPPSSWPSLAKVLPKPVPLEMSIVQGSGLQWARPVALKGMSGGPVSFILWSLSRLGPQVRAKQRGFGSCHSSPLARWGSVRPLLLSGRGSLGNGWCPLSLHSLGPLQSGERRGQCGGVFTRSGFGTWIPA